MPARARVASERNVVVEVAAPAADGARHGGSTRRARTRSPEVARRRALEVTAATATNAVEHGELRIEALQHDLGGVAVLSRLVLPLVGAEGALDIDLGAFLQILLGDLAEPFIEDDHTVPLGFLLALAGCLVAPGFGCGHTQMHNRLAVLGAPHFRISAEITDQNDLVHRARHNILLLAFA